MITMNAADWYWIVAGSTNQVFSSARNAYVPPTDTDYQAWLAGGNFVGEIRSETELWEVLTQRGVILPSWMFDGVTFVQPAPGAYTKAQLKAYAAMVRYNKEVAGTTVDTVAYPSDRETQAKMTSAVLMSQVAPSITFKWKKVDGTFANLDAAGILRVAQGVGAYVQAAFAIESSLVSGIDGGTISTLLQIDAAFA